MDGSAVSLTVGIVALVAVIAVAAEVPARESPPAAVPTAPVPERLYGVHFNPQSAAPPGTGHWLLDYPLIRERIQGELAELVQETGVNFLDIMVLIPFTLRDKATPPTDTARAVSAWANLTTLANLVDFLDCCHRLGLSVEIDLATNMWVPYRVDTANHIGQSEWWPKPDDTPWTEAAVWYEQIIRHVEKAVADPAAIACWTMMGNYQLGGAEPVTWDWPEQPEVMAFTERFVKAVWPRFRAAATRPVGSPIMLPILADDEYWRRQTPEMRLSSVRNLKRWLVDDLRLPPDYWVMSTYPCCDPATDGVYYLREIVRILGPANAGRVISTDFKGEGHALTSCIVDKAGLSGAAVLQWHFGKVSEYGFAGWWVWGYQDGENDSTGLRDRQGRWKPALVRAIRERALRAGRGPE
jgi:hypothetical protein